MYRTGCAMILKHGGNTTYAFSVLCRTVRRLSSQKKTYEEIKIPVPWGHIAGKWWGRQDRRPILGCHGWQDNSGTFDRLVTYLPEDVGFLAIDFPGHGLSSRIPNGMNYHIFDYPVYVKRIVDYFQWPKVSLIGHSLGAVVSFVYSSLYPERAEFVVCIDALYPFREDPKVECFRKTIDNFVKYDSFCIRSEQPPSYPLDQLPQILHTGYHKSIAVENAKYLLQRNVAPCKKRPDHFYFTRDPRLKASAPMPLTQKQIIELAQRVNFPIAVFKADDNVYFGRTPFFYEVLDVLKKTSKDCRIFEVEGTHHVHLNNPERLGEQIYDFVKKYHAENAVEDEVKVVCSK